jgi:hypothetical protein
MASFQTVCQRISALSSAPLTTEIVFSIRGLMFPTLSIRQEEIYDRLLRLIREIYVLRALNVRNNWNDWIAWNGWNYPKFVKL